MDIKQKYEFFGYPKNYEKHPLSKIILKYVKKSPVLDIGCGNGNLLYLLKNKLDVEGFDPSEIAVKLARKKGLNVKLASIEDFRTNRKFKTILMIGVLVLSNNPEEYLKKARKWLDKDGVIMLTMPNAIAPKILLKILKEDKHIKYLPSYFEFGSFLKKNGFEIIKCIPASRLKISPILSSVNFYIIRLKNP